MKNKKLTLNTILYGVVSLILIVLYLVLPLFKVDTIHDFNVNGFKLLTGTYEKQQIGGPRVILGTSSFNFIPVLFPVAIFFFYLILSSDPVKKLSSLIAGIVSFAYVVFVPVIAFSLRNLNYDSRMDITKSWGWYVLISIYLVFVIYMLVDLILTIRNEKKKLSEEE